MSKKKVVGVLRDDYFLQHKTGYHVESPERLRVIHEKLDPLMDKVKLIASRKATDAEVILNHDISYVKRLKSFGAGSLDTDTVLSTDSADVALHAVGGCLNMVDEIMKENIDAGFAFVRPPGHHAEKSGGMGFCLFNNIAIAARYLIKRRNLERIAIVDWDLHHGNGTQHSFYESDKVLFMSIHQSPCYPGAGLMEETGERQGEGYTVNLPIAAGAGDTDYLSAFEKLFVPIISSYQPQIILISAGFDAHKEDPLGAMNVSAEGFAEMTRIALKLADTFSNKRIAFFLEGGYNLDALGDSVEKMLKTTIENAPTRKINTEEMTIKTALNQAVAIQSEYWPILADR